MKSKRQMKFSIFIPMNTLIYEDIISGADIFVIELAKRLKTEYEIHVMTTEIGKRLWLTNVAVAKIYKISSFGKNCSPIFVPIILMLRTVAACFFVLGIQNKFSEKPFVYYSPSDYLCDIMPIVIMKLKNRRNIWISRIHHVNLPPWKRRGNFLLNALSFLGQRLSFLIIKLMSDSILTLSGTYNGLIDLGFPENKLGILNPGVDLETINNVVPALDKKYDAIFVGRLHPTKGIYDLVEIWRNVVKAKKKAKLAIIGGGPEKIVSSLKKYIVNHNLKKNIDLIGYLPNKIEVYKLLKSTKIYVDAEHEDGWSMSGTEAMACGLPMVAYNLEMFKAAAFKGGFITVPFRDFKAFSDVVIKLLDDEDIRLKLSKEAHQGARSLGWDKISKQLSSDIQRKYKVEQY